MPHWLHTAFALVLYEPIMAPVTRSVLRWTPSAGATSSEHLVSEGLTILAFGMVAALVVYGL